MQSAPLDNFAIGRIERHGNSNEGDQDKEDKEPW